ncbi:hypothetical protein PATSB16_34050 [Pandoraea thiooxydans]|nr:hypothetical protein PATSB16_34050 [Pandoraea thiooxydans]
MPKFRPEGVSNIHAAGTRRDWSTAHGKVSRAGRGRGQSTH